MPCEPLRERVRTDCPDEKTLTLPALSGGITPVTGDWDANGTTTVGWYRASDSSFHLTNGHDATSELAYVYGPPNSGGIRPVTGDWNRA